MDENVVDNKVCDVGQNEAWAANFKRTYDEMQQESLETVRRSRDQFNKLMSDAQQYDNQRQLIANQALQNSVETANMVAKKAIAHGDVAHDRVWNIDEVSMAAANRDGLEDIIRAVLGDVLADMADKDND